MSTHSSGTAYRHYRRDVNVASRSASCILAASPAASSGYLDQAASQHVICLNTPEQEVQLAQQFMETRMTNRSCSI
jgi:hypothetical protein